MMWDIRLLSSGKENSAGVACLHRGTLCFTGHMQIGERSQDRNDNMTLKEDSFEKLGFDPETRRPGKGQE